MDRNISRIRHDYVKTRVALLAEGVDRNPRFAPLILRRLVALLAEGVDRNSVEETLTRNPKSVALLAEGVDRNRSESLSCTRGS